MKKIINKKNLLQLLIAIIALSFSTSLSYADSDRDDDDDDYRRGHHREHDDDDDDEWEDDDDDEFERYERKIIKFYKKNLPEAVRLYEELEKVYEQNEDEFEYQEDELEEFLFDKFEHYQDVKNHNPKLVELLKKNVILELQARLVGFHIQRLTKEGGKHFEAANKLQNKLKEILEQTFEIKIQLQSSEIETMEKEVVKFKQVLEKRKAMKDQIINNRLLELTGMEEAVYW